MYHEMSSTYPPRFNARSSSLHTRVNDTGDQVAEELAQAMPDLKLVMDEGCAVLEGVPHAHALSRLSAK